MLRRAFTLLEILTVVAIISVIVATAVVGLNSGTDAARLRGSVRDIFATIRQARTTALVTQNPCVLTYSVGKVDGEPCAKVEIVSAKMFGANPVTKVETLSGETIDIGDGQSGEEGGETMEEILFAPISDDVVKGIVLKVLKEGEQLEESEREAEKNRPKISVFSNVDYLIGRYNDAKKEAESKETEEEEKTGGADTSGFSSGDDDQPPTSVVWEVNGRCEPHRVWVYRAGKSPESGLQIRVDRFGAVKIVAGDED